MIWIVNCPARLPAAQGDGDPEPESARLERPGRQVTAQPADPLGQARQARAGHAGAGHASASHARARRVPGTGAGAVVQDLRHDGIPPAGHGDGHAGRAGVPDHVGDAFPDRPGQHGIHVTGQAQGAATARTASKPPWSPPTTNRAMPSPTITVSHTQGTPRMPGRTGSRTIHVTRVMNATTPTSSKSVAGVTCRQTAATAGMSTKYAMIAKKMSWRPRRLPAGG
jgi:hypothetical protein